MIPGFGTLVAVTGGALADMSLVLKYETELAMALTHLYGFDIRSERGRRIALALASVSTYDEKSGEDLLVDIAETEVTAIWNYGGRQLSKLLLTVMARLALIQLGKSALRAVPFAGMAVGASVNRILTKGVGDRLVAQLEVRRSEEDGAEAARARGANVDEDGVVEARIVEDDDGH